MTGDSKPPEKKDLRKKELDVDKHEEEMHMGTIVTEAIRGLQTLVGVRRPIYHTLQKYLECMKYVKNMGVARLPHYGTRAPMAVEQTRDHCIMAVVCYLVIEYWKYQQGEQNQKNIELTCVYCNCLAEIPYVKLTALGTARTGYYVWSNPSKQLDES